MKGNSQKYSDCRCITTLKTTTISFSRTQAHDKVKANPGSLYVEKAGSRANLIAATREGLKYVRTAPNDMKEDNLLKVREC